MPVLLCVFAIAGLAVAFLGGLASPHYAVQFLLFVGLWAGLKIVLITGAGLPHWLLPAAAGAESFAFLSLILFVEAISERPPEIEATGHDDDVRARVFTACTQIARNMKELDIMLPYEQWFARGVDIIATALRDVLGYQHISLAQLEEGRTDAQAVSGFLVHNGYPRDMQVFIRGAIMQQLI